MARATAPRTPPIAAFPLGAAAALGVVVLEGEVVELLLVCEPVVVLAAVVELLLLEVEVEALPDETVTLPAARAASLVTLNHVLAMMGTPAWRTTSSTLKPLRVWAAALRPSSPMPAMSVVLRTSRT